MLRDKIIAAARTGFAVLGVTIVVFVVGKLADFGVIVKVDETWSTVLAGAMFAVFVGVYNVIVQWLTENVWGGFGWLLGNLPAPSYVDADLRTEPDEDPGLAVDSSEIRAADDSDSPEYLPGPVDPHS